MKNNEIINLRVLGASLCLSAILLTGCGEEKILVGSSAIIVEEGTTTGSISYENLSNYVKVVNFQQNELNFTRLMIKEESYITVMYGRSHSKVQYKDLETGATFIEYRDYAYADESIDWSVGENIVIINEVNITSYLLSTDFVKKEYTVEELLTFFYEKILPTLENDNKELIK